ncbi:hypothetical protein FKP32DRAFT_604363 [Trametes sanguinea]|nr:hypothetical protein FKP32DRAFT_604363 [Trametes sanguinea]
MTRSPRPFKLCARIAPCHAIPTHSTPFRLPRTAPEHRTCFVSRRAHSAGAPAFPFLAHLLTRPFSTAPLARTQFRLGIFWRVLTSILRGAYPRCHARITPPSPLPLSSNGLARPPTRLSVPRQAPQQPLSVLSGRAFPSDTCVVAAKFGLGCRASVVKFCSTGARGVRPIKAVQHPN